MLRLASHVLSLDELLQWLLPLDVALFPAVFYDGFPQLALEWRASHKTRNNFEF